MNRQSGNLVSLVAIGVVVIGLASLIAWRWYETADVGGDNPPAASSEAQSTDKSTLEQLGYEGKRHTSSQKAFSIVVPNGWQLNSNTEFDGMFAGTLEYDASKEPVVELTAYGKDGPAKFAVVMNTEVGYGSSTFDAIPGEEFSTNAGVVGVKKVKMYKAGDPLGMGDAEGGDKQYLYEFKKDGRYYDVSHYVAPGGTDDHEFVEKVARSLEIQS